VQDNYSLVVIDMQPTAFPAAYDVIDGCSKAIKKTIKSNNPVIYIEYSYSNFKSEWPTTPRLTNITDNYNKTFYLKKNEQDGSKQITSLIKKNKLPNDKVLVCGVKTTACVLSTVKGLNNILKNSSLFILDGAVGGHCNDTWYKRYQDINNCFIIKI